MQATAPTKFENFAAAVAELALTATVPLTAFQWTSPEGKTYYYAEFPRPGRELPSRTAEFTSPKRALTYLKDCLDHANLRNVKQALDRDGYQEPIEYAGLREEERRGGLVAFAISEGNGPLFPAGSVAVCRPISGGKLADVESGTVIFAAIFTAEPEAPGGVGYLSSVFGMVSRNTLSDGGYLSLLDFGQQFEGPLNLTAAELPEVWGVARLGA